MRDLRRKVKYPVAAGMKVRTNYKRSLAGVSWHAMLHVIACEIAAP
jgi:hypothetical protein